MSITLTSRGTRYNGMITSEDEQNRPTPMIGNINSPSVSVASVSSDDGEQQVQQPMELISDPRHLHLELRKLTEALARLRRAFQDTADRGPDYTRNVTTERLGDMLGILRPLLTRYADLQTPEVMGSVENLIEQVTHTCNYGDYHSSAVDFYEALDSLRAAMSHSVSEFVASDCESTYTRTSPNIVFPSYGDQASAPDSELDLDYNGATRKDAIISVDQVDAVLMRHDRGVDVALDRAKTWSKYTKDVATYVEKRIGLEIERAKNMAKLAQERRPVLNEESFLPFQSNYCIALDVDLEMCTKTQQACSLLQDCKFVEPLKVQRTKHDSIRKNLRDKWNKERKRLQYAVIQLKKAKEIYFTRHQEYERCHEAVRIAEQGAEIGATAENKVDKRKRLEEDALQKTADSEAQYRMCVEEANERHRNILLVKTEILRGVRELLVEGDQLMKEVTVNYFQQLHQLHNSLPDHYATLCESSRLYEPGSQYMEYVKTMPEAQVQNSTMSDPFSFEPITGDAIDNSRHAPHHHSRKGHRDSSAGYLLDSESSGPQQSRRREAWTPSMGAIDPSDTESVESERSSPSGSPLVSTATQENQASARERGEHPVIYFDNDTTDYAMRNVNKSSASAATAATAASDHEISTGSGIPTSPTTPPRRQIIPMSRAAISHRFRKIKTPSKCRECDTIVVYFNGFDCTECGLSSHKKCLETLALQCGHRRLPRKMAMFGVDLSIHVHEANSQIPTILVKCVQEINDRGLTVQGIYRVSGAKQRIDRLCQAFENGPAELVDLTNIPPNVIADVLKNYMRQLPEPLLTNALSPEFIHVAETYPSPPPSAIPKDSTAGGLAPLATAESSSPPGATNNTTALDDDQRMAISKLRELCRRLPKAHYYTLAYLMHHLSRVATEQEANSMTASNLAIVFAPTLMKTNKDIGMGAVDETKHHARVIELLIVHATQVFGPPELVAPREQQHRNDHHHRGPRSRGLNTRSRGSRDNSDLISSQTERRGEVSADEFSIPGLVSSEEHAVGAEGSNEDIFGASVSDDDDDADPIPLFLLDGTAARPGRSPMLMRGNSSPPLIIKQSLKNFSGLEGVTPGMLSTQDSLEAAQAQRAMGNLSLVTQSSAPAMTATAKRTVHHESSMPVASEVSTAAVFHKMGKVSKKHSIDNDPDNIFSSQGGGGGEDNGENKSPPPTVQQTSSVTNRPLVTTTSSSAAAAAAAGSAARSGSLSEEALSKQRRGVSAKEMSQSMPATILNLEENRVTIQVPGSTSSVKPPAVVKQSSIDRDEAE